MKFDRSSHMESRGEFGAGVKKQHMSKVIKSSPYEKRTIGFGYGYVLSSDSESYMTGRLCTFIETLGLRETQEKAAKDILRQEVSSWFLGPNGALGITGNLNTAIHEIVWRVQEEYKNLNSGSALPSGDASYEIIATLD